MKKFAVVYIALLLVLLPLWADGRLGVLAGLWMQSAVLLLSCAGAAVCLWKRGKGCTVTAMDACFAAWAVYGMVRGFADGEVDVARWTGLLSVASLYLFCRVAGGKRGVALGAGCLLPCGCPCLVHGGGLPGSL